MSAVTAVLRTEARLFAREPGAWGTIVAFPPVLVAVLGAVPAFREPSPDFGGQSLVGLYVPIAVLLAMLGAAVMAMPAVLLGYREAGVLRRLRTTPLDPAAPLLAQTFLHAAAVVVAVVLTLGLAGLVFGVALPGAPGGYALAFLLCLAAVAAVGGLITALASNPRSGQAIALVAFIPLMFTSGVYFPVQAMGGTLRTVVELTPLGAGVQALNAAQLGQFPDLAHLAVVAGWAVVLGLLAVLAARRRV